MRHVHGDYELDDDPGRVDRDAVWAFLSTEAYWARWRTRDVVEAQIDDAWRVVGAYERSTGVLAGFARAFSDGAAHACLSDLFVVPSARGQGLGKELVRVMVEDGPGSDFRWSLHTADAHGLYARFGFDLADYTYLERPGRHAPPPDSSEPTVPDPGSREVGVDSRQPEPGAGRVMSHPSPGPAPGAHGDKSSARLGAVGSAPFGVTRLKRLTRRGHRLYLLAATVVAGMTGLLISLLTLQILRTGDVFCDATRNGVVCPDGISYALPGLGIAVGIGTLLLAVAVADLTRRLPQPRRLTLAVDLARLAALPMLLAGVAFLCLFLVSPSLSVLGYSALLIAAGITPVQARRYGETAFVVTGGVLALTAFAVAVPAVLVAPLLGGYGIVLLLAVGVAFSARTPARTTPEIPLLSSKPR